MELKQQAVSHSIVVHSLFSVLNRKVTYCVFLWDEYTVKIYIYHRTSVEWWWCGRVSCYSVTLNGDIINQSCSKGVGWSESFWLSGSLSVTKQFVTDEGVSLRSKRITPTYSLLHDCSTTSLFSGGWCTCVRGTVHFECSLGPVTHSQALYVYIAHTFCMCSRSTV